MPAGFFRFAPLAVMALSWLAYSQHGFKPLPKLVVQAKYVLVTTYQGYNLASPNVMPDDREAVVAVQNAIKRWGKYELAYKPEDADLILLVRKGRIVATQPQVRLGKSSTKPLEVSGAAPVNAGDARDMLAMFEAQKGLDGPALGETSYPGGWMLRTYSWFSSCGRLSRRPPRSRSGIGAHRNSLQNREFSPTLVRIRTLLVVSEQCVLNPSPDRPHICFDFSQ